MTPVRQPFTRVNFIPPQSGTKNLAAGLSRFTVNSHAKFVHFTLIPIIPHVHRVTVQSDLRKMIDKEDPVAHIGVRVLLVI
jgi:hypothetical protein